MKRFSIYLKDGRTASVDGTRMDPNVDRPFLGQARGFIIVSLEDAEAAVFLATDVIGWTVEPSANEAASLDGPREWTPTVISLSDGAVSSEPEEVEAAI